MSGPIRVLHVFGRLDLGGAESRTMDIYRSIDRSKVQFDFAIHTEDECFFNKEVQSLGGRIFSFPKFNGKNYLKYKNSWDNFFKEHPEYNIIHGHKTTTGFIYLKEAKKYGVRLRIAHARNANKDKIIKRFTTKLVRLYATDYLAVSKKAAVSEFGKKYFKSGKVKVLPNAIDVKKYSFNDKKRKKMRKELGLHDDDLAIVHIGRFHKQKNHMFLIDIFKQIININQNVKLFIIGDGPEKNEIIDKVNDLGLSNYVDLLGIRSDIANLIQAMDVLLFPSLYEGLPGVVVEAQSAGIPCIISSNITEEVAITDLVKFVDLSKSPKYWSTVLLNESDLYNNRIKYSKEVSVKYDVNSIAKLYEEYYNK